MYSIYKRAVQQSVPSWKWFFDQLRWMTRRLVKIDDIAIQDGSLDRSHFEEGYWVEIAGMSQLQAYREDWFSEWTVHMPEHGGRGVFGGPTSLNVFEKCTIGLRRSILTLDVNATGRFLVSYEFVAADKLQGHGARGTYATIHIDGRRHDQATDYAGGDSGFTISPAGDPKRLSGFAAVNLIKGVHKVEVALITSDRVKFRKLNVSFAELH
jgi:hypothetical protein